ncbi:MAG: hypothetical protein KGL39_49250 [Patescibacteria group bacterium]|nr:hypothetical protein [Patescibacteria group bacterium]
MPLQSALGIQSGLRPMEEYLSERRDAARTIDDSPDTEGVLTPEEQERFKILRYCANLLDEARKAREPFETFDVAWDLFVGNVWPTRWPTWRAKITINKIRAFITFMQAVMTDNKPRLSVEPLIPGSEDAADLLRKLVDRDWDENTMQQKVATFVLYGLIWGTGFMKVWYDPYADGGRGKHMATPVVPYRIFTNRTATCIEDAEYIIQVEDMTMGWVRRNFPDKAKLVYEMRGVRSTGAQRDRDRDYIREGDANETQRIISAQNVDGNITGPQYSSPNPQYNDGDGDTVEIAEYWLRDETLEAYQRQKVVNGQPQYEPAIGADGLYQMQTVAQRVATSEIDGQPFMAPVMRPAMKPVMETAWRLKYPNGRLVIIAAGRILLRDIPNPFQTDGFPYAMWKDYDVGSFWGQGEPIALKDCEIAKNRIISQLYDILEKTGNPSFKLKKGAGVNAQTIKNKPGAIIPMDEMDALQPLDKPQIPPQFVELYNMISKGMGEVSGVNDAVIGAAPAANTAFATMDQLQESGAAPIRLKVRNLETGITRIGKLRIQLIQQWDNGQRPLRERTDTLPPGWADDEGNVVQPAANVQARFRSYSRADLQGQVEFGVVPISSLSTSPAGAWNRWMAMLDKHLIDRRWWHDKWRIEGWRTELPRMERTEMQEAQLAAAAKQSSKPGPAPKSLPSKGHRKKPPTPSPQSFVPTRQQNAVVR